MLLDTSGLLNHQHTSEPYHNEALTFFEHSGPKLTHSYVLAEFVALAQVRGLPRQKALTFVRNLPLHPLVEVVWVDESLHNQALTLLDARPDKDYSLCDAVSFVLMKERHITEALTSDHHFEQEGFKRLLLPKD